MIAQPRRLGLFAAGCALLLLATQVWSQSRDAQAPATIAATGTAVIAGSVVSEAPNSRPLRRATVRVSETGLPGRIVITDDAGRFVMRNLPPGRYQVFASKPAYVAGTYGASGTTAPGQIPTGTAIALADGQQVTDIVIELTRGAVITGTIRDPDGLPARSVSLRLAYQGRSYTTGERTLVDAPHYATTDDRGEYRFFGVRPGAYVVVCSPGVGLLTDVRATTDVDVRQARAAIDRPGMLAPAAAGGSAGAQGRGRSVGFVPVYYPGTTIAASAALVTVDAGEERTGVDFQLQLAPTSRIDGRVVYPDGRPASGMAVRLIAPGMGEFGAISGADGRYRFGGIVHGAYTVLTRTAPAPPGRGGPPGAQTTEALWATGTASMQGEDVTLDLTLRPGLTLSGRVVFDAATLAAPDPARARVWLSSLTGLGTMTATMDTTTGSPGAFTIAGVIPGAYHFSATMPGGAPGRPAWMARSAVAGGLDLLDGRVDVGAGDLNEIVVTFTDRTTELGGVIVDASGRPAPEYFLIAFAAERTHWVPNSRRVQQTRPSRDGKFTFLNLPPGDYLLGAVTSVEQNQWFDPEFLARIADAAIKVTISDGERKVQDLRVR